MSEMKVVTLNPALTNFINSNKIDVGIMTHAISEVIDALKKAQENSDSICTCEARVICTCATEDSIPHHMNGGDGLIHMGNIEEINKTNIEICENFEGCTKSPDSKCYIAEKYKEWIADEEWKAVDESSSQGEEKENLDKETSYMVCTEYGGIIYFYDDGQKLLSNYLYNNNPFYKATADHISNINKLTEDWSELLMDIQEVYEKNREVYEAISVANGYIPPELVAAIHYRENATDYLAGTFSVYLHNGDPLGAVSMKEPYPGFFSKDEFKEAAIDALEGENNYIINRAKALYLTTDSEDIVAMVALSVLYNGWNHNGKTSYAYNGTDLVSQGLYTSDHNYDPNASDNNLGTYLVIKALLNQ